MNIEEARAIRAVSERVMLAHAYLDPSSPTDQGTRNAIADLAEAVARLAAIVEEVL